jgi:hypothetical protein
MAVLDQTQIKVQWSDSGARRWALFAVLAITTGDTFDLGAYYRVVKQVAWMGATVSGVVSGSFTGTVLTVPAGLSSDSAYALVDGVPL